MLTIFSARTRQLGMRTKVSRVLSKWKKNLYSTNRAPTGSNLQRFKPNLTCTIYRFYKQIALGEKITIRTRKTCVCPNVKPMYLSYCAGTNIGGLARAGRVILAWRRGSLFERTRYIVTLYRLYILLLYV